MSKSNMTRIKFEFEDHPIIDVRKPMKTEEELDSIFTGIKDKIFGRKK